MFDSLFWNTSKCFGFVPIISFDIGTFVLPLTLLRHSDLDAAKVSECTRRDTPPHWLGNEVRDPDAQPRKERELPPVLALWL